jgi:two-component system, NarL family, invasion response regulator UvrY
MKILFADDHPMIRQLVRKVLLTEFPLGLIEGVADGFALVQSALSGRWDVVIADISMPVMNGLDAIREIRWHQPSIPVLVLSSHTEVEYAQHAFSVGANGYVHKYKIHEDLGKAVRGLMRKG